jgi:hypothetical protein
MEKRKMQQDVESGNEILTCMLKVGKMNFTKGYPKSDPSLKLPNQKKKCTITSNKKLIIGIK